MASQNYLIAIALIEQKLVRAMPLGGKEIKDNLEEIENFKKLGEDQISYTFRLSYRDKDKTLLDSDITSIHSNIISNIEKCFNTKLRD